MNSRLLLTTKTMMKDYRDASLKIFEASHPTSHTEESVCTSLQQMGYVIEKEILRGVFMEPTPQMVQNLQTIQDFTEASGTLLSTHVSSLEAADDDQANLIIKAFMNDMSALSTSMA